MTAFNPEAYQADGRWLWLHYTCPSCGAEWHDEWSCLVDDDCPECGARDVSPDDDEAIDVEDQA